MKRTKQEEEESPPLPQDATMPDWDQDHPATTIQKLSRATAFARTEEELL